MTGELAKNTLNELIKYVEHEEVQKRYEKMLGDDSAAFINCALNLVRNSEKLQNCTMKSIKSSMMKPATLKLSIEQAIGHCFIIPYGNQAVFQIGYKGVIQLCIRSGQYKLIHCSEIYADELKGYNPITGQVDFNSPSTFKQRMDGDYKNVVGHYAYFKLVSGFEKGCYMTTKEVLAHARKYSTAYQRDLKQGKKDSPWSTNPIPMGNKTVLLRLLTKFGIMSVEMQKAIVSDNGFEATEEATRKQIEAEQGSEAVDANFEPKPPSPDLAKDPFRDSKKTKKKAAKKKVEAKEKDLQALYSCNNKKCGIQFDQPKISGSADTEVPICPKCLTSDIKMNKNKPEFMKD